MKPTYGAHSSSGDPWLRFLGNYQTAVQLGEMAIADFEQAKQDLCNKDCGYTRRNLVRAFGSLMDVLAAIFRDVSGEMNDETDLRRNQFLREKSGERGATASFRVKAAYRLAAEIWPRFAEVGSHRWEQLHQAFEVRNRVLHPATIAGMTVSDADLELIHATADDFRQDLEVFFGLCQLHAQKLFQSTDQHRVRTVAKIRLTHIRITSDGRPSDPIRTEPLAA